MNIEEIDVPTVLCPQPRLVREAGGETPEHPLLRGIEGYVQRHLGDPGLSPRSLAAAHHISVSYLHRLFRSRGTTVAAWIREQRLERARHDLADPGLADVPVHRIAARWGFCDHATFTRAFRAAYRVPPSEYRLALLGSGRRDYELS